MGLAGAPQKIRRVCVFVAGGRGRSGSYKCEPVTSLHGKMIDCDAVSFQC